MIERSWRTYCKASLISLLLPVQPSHDGELAISATQVTDTSVSRLAVLTFENPWMTRSMPYFLLCTCI